MTYVNILQCKIIHPGLLSLFTTGLIILGRRGTYTVCNEELCYSRCGLPQVCRTRTISVFFLAHFPEFKTEKFFLELIPTSSNGFVCVWPNFPKIRVQFGSHGDRKLHRLCANSSSHLHSNRILGKRSIHQITLANLIGSNVRLNGDLGKCTIEQFHTLCPSLDWVHCL